MANWWTLNGTSLNTLRKGYGWPPVEVEGCRFSSGQAVATRLMRSLCLPFFLILVIPAQAAKAPDRKAFATAVCRAIDKASATHDLDRVFFTRLLWKESLFDPNAVSPKGAQGLAQFMPETAERRKLEDPFEPLAAIDASASFLSDLKKQFGNLGLAAAAYNAGESRIERWLAGTSQLPDETENYVASITGHVADDWKDKAANHGITTLGKTGDFTSQCVALASRQVNPTSSGVRRSKSMPWGALLAADFNEGRALSMFKRLKLRYPKVLDGAQPFVIRKKNLSRGSKKMAFVMMGAKTQAEAQALCAKYTAAGLPCLVKKNS
jgi:Transglycosylase SLT domain